MPPSPKFQKEFTVTSYELNPGGQARLTTVANYFQEIAHRHANELRFGYEDMKNHRTMWLLTRMKIRMTNYPMWNEKIRIETWPSGVDKLFFIRDYMVMNEAGVEMGKATSYWLIVNIETHRPVRSREALEQYGRIVSGEPVFDTGLEKIDLPDLQDTLGSHKVLYSDLDIVGHVNNVKYMELCIVTALWKGMQD
jgi:acyl-ACP thioesterase